jgi:hypothetical protein
MISTLRSSAVAPLLLFSFLFGGGFDPPARYDHPNSHVIVQWKSWQEVQAFCGQFNPAHQSVAGCAVTGVKPCLIIAYHGSSFGDARLLRHEIGHCNGWPKDHPA